MLKKLKILIIAFFVIILMLPTTVLSNTVEYRGVAEGLITTPDDFFLNLGQLLPGDTKQDVAYLKNTTDNTIELFFKTESLDRSEYYDEIDYSLLEKISLTISLKKTSNSEEIVIYQGNLGAELLNDYISLGKYNKGEDGEFIFKIEVPAELRNDYSLSTTKVKWVFAVGELEKESGNVQTGDKIYYIIGVVLAIIIVNIIILIIRKKEKKKKKKSKVKKLKN